MQAVTILLLSFALAPIVLSQGPRQPQGTNNKPVAAQGQRGTEQAPLVVKLDSAAQAREAREHQEERHESMAVEERVATYTFYLAVVTAALVFATIALWRATARLVKGAEDTAERQLRAYVGVSAASIENVVHQPALVSDYADFLDTAAGAGPRGRITVNLTLKNAGQTPAYHVVSWFTLSVAAIHGDAAMPPEPNDYRERQILLPEGTLDKTGLFPALTLPDLKNVAVRTHGVFINGAISYDDAFGRARTSRFRLFYKFPYEGGAPALSQLNIANVGNEAT